MSLDDITSSVCNLDVVKSLSLVEENLMQGIPASQIIAAIGKGLEIVGEKFESREYFLVELVTAAYCASKCIGILEERLKEQVEEAEKTGTIVIGTVEGDLHDIGKNIVIAMLRGAGFKVYDLGIDVHADRFIQKIREVNADMLGMSALLTMTAPYMEKVIDALKEAGIRDLVKVVVGGRATDEAFTKEIGADAYGRDAFEAVTIAKKLMGERR